MGLAVVTVASGGMPVVEATYGTPVTEAINKFGLPVTKVVGKPGLPVIFESIGVITSPAFTSWNPADLANTTLTNGNLTATSTLASSGVRAGRGLSAGKQYFEVTVTSAGTAAIGLIQGGIALPTNSIIVAGSVTTNTAGVIQVNGSTVGVSIGSINGFSVHIAVDLTAVPPLIWFRNGNTAIWNGNGANNPGTGVGGVNFSAVAGPLFPYFAGILTAGQTVTANFGASAFVGAVPAGFTAGWPG